MGWPMISLADILVRRDEQIAIDPNTTYRQITARLWGQGLTLRGNVAGADVAATSQKRVSSGQFLISKIDARHGAFGLVPDDLDGAIVSNDFPVFDVNTERAVPSFVRWVSKTDWFVALCERASEGSTNRVRLRERAFLAQEIPLPPLDVQQRIVERLDGVEARVNDIRRLRKHRELECAHLLRGLLRNEDDAVSTPMRELLRPRDTNVTVDANETYHFAGVYSFGRGVFRSEIKNGLEFSYPRLTRLQAGNFTYPKLMAWEGALGVVPPECEGCVVSPEFPVFEIDTSRILPEVLEVYFQDSSVWPQLVSTGTNARRRRLNPADFLSYMFPLPSDAVQQQVANACKLLRRARAHDEQIEQDLEAFLPAMLAEVFAESAEAEAA